MPLQIAGAASGGILTLWRSEGGERTTEMREVTLLSTSWIRCVRGRAWATSPASCQGLPSCRTLRQYAQGYWRVDSLLAYGVF